MPAGPQICGWQAQDSGKAADLSTRIGKPWCPSLKVSQADRTPSYLEAGQGLLLFNLSTDWMRRTYIRECNLLCPVYQFKIHPKTPSPKYLESCLTKYLDIPWPGQIDTTSRHTLWDAQIFRRWKMLSTEGRPMCIFRVLMPEAKIVPGLRGQ